jgi:hypothetical protein
MVKVEVPAASGVPESVPLAGFKVSQMGRVPVEADQVKGGVPPVTDSVCKYGTLITAVLNCVWSIDNGKITAIVYFCVANIEFAPVTLMVKVKAPAAVGVPEIIPVDVPNPSPSGRVPLSTVHVKVEDVLPEAVNVWLYAPPTVAPGNEEGVMINEAGNQSMPLHPVNRAINTRCTIKFFIVLPLEFFSMVIPCTPMMQALFR